MTSSPGSFPVQKRTSNPHHLIVEQKSIQIIRDFSQLFRETLYSSKSNEILSKCHKQFVQCDKVFLSTEDKLERITKNLKSVEKSEERIINSLSTISTIQGIYLLDSI